MKDRKAEVIAFLQHEKNALELPNSNNEYPCSPNQRSLYFNYKKDTSSSSYNMVSIYELEENVEINRFNKAVNEVVKRHEALRTCFFERNNQLIQKIIPFQQSKVDISLFNYENYDEDEVVKILKTEAQRRFNLEKGKPLRVTLIQTGSRSLLLLNLHHIVGDLLSLKIITQEIYENYIGNGLNLPPLNQHYKDYCVWLEKKLTNSSEAEEMWMEKFSNLETATSLQNDLNFSTDNANAKYITYSFPEVYLKTFKKICQENNSSFYVGFSSLVSLLLNKITGSNDITFGSPVTARHLLNHQDQVGYYVNTIPVRIKVDNEISFTDFLKKNRINLNECINLSYYPLPYLIKNLQKGQESLKGLFNILVVYQNQEAFHTSEFIRKLYNKLELSAKYDLIIEFSDIVGGNIDIKMEYNESLYSADYINVIYKALCSLIENVCKEPNTTLKDIELINDADKTKIQLELNNTAKDFPSHETIVSLFDKSVERYAQQTAIIHKNISYSFHEINRRANQLSHFLQSKGVEKGEVIPISTDKSVETIIGILAILKIGAAYSPIDKLYPKQRQEQLRQLTGGKLQLDETLWQEFSEIAVSFPDTAISTIISPDDLLYVIFTSGSTGTPKGCMLNNKGVVNRLNWMWNHYGFSIEHTILQKTSFSFDVSVWELFLPLCWGCKMVLCEDGSAQKPDQILELISKYKVNHIHFVPSMLEAFINYLTESKTQPSATSSLKNVYTSGEALTKQTVERWYNYTNIPVKNLYGPTEASVDVTYYDVHPDSQNIYIGKPIDNICIYILNDDKILPVGLYGEICIAGVGLALGYLGDAEKTDEKFIFQNNLNTRLYRTGDIGRYTADGFIEFLGRKDDQVKIRGFRIELNEIDYAIANLKYINACRTLCDKNKLICYFVPENRSEDGDIETIIRKDIKQLLPDYMIPHFFIEIDEIPTTVNGKLDRNKLAQTQKKKKEYTSQTVVGNKETILSIWAGVLDTSVENIDPSKNFFENGGDSLSLLNLISKLNNIGINITYDAFIAAPYLANIINDTDAIATALVELNNNSFILSPIQEWYFEKNPNNFSFIMYSTHLLAENYSIETIKIALNAICQKHSSFRLRYSQDLMWQQYYDTEVLIDQLYVFHDFIPEKDKNMEECIEEAEQTIDTLKGPLLYVSLFKHDEGTAIFFACPHLIMDAVSWNIFTNDFVYYYNNPTLKPVYTKTYKDWVLNHLSNSNGNINKDEINYWIEQVLDENTYRSGFTTQNRMENLSIPNIHNNLKSTENIILAALTYVLGKTLHLNTIYFEKEGHGREMVNNFDSSEIIGWFTSKYPVKYNLDVESLIQTYFNVVNTNENMSYSGVWFDKYKRLAPQPIRNALNKELPFSFNYLGSLSQSSVNRFPLDKPLIALNSYINSENLEEIRKRFYLLEVNCGVLGDEIFLSLNASERLGLNDGEWADFLEQLNSAIQTLMEYSKNNPQGISDDDGSLSAFQKELIAHSLIHADNLDNYIIQWEFKIKGVDKARLKNSCRELLRKFEILRTAYFYNVQSGLFCSEVLFLEDAFVFNEYTAVNCLKEKLKELKNITIGSNKPLIKFSLINSDSETDIFVISAHHALVDGHSMFIVLNELLNAYENKPLENVYVPYKEYVQHIQAKDKKTAINYWKAMLSGFLTKKIETTSYNNASFNERSVTFKLSQKIQNEAKTNRLTLSAVFNFLFGNTYSVLMNEENLVWGNIVNYRTAEMENMDGIVGPCINTIPVCFDFNKSGATLFNDIAMLQKQVITSQQFSYLSLQEILTTVAQKKLFNLLFTYQNYKKTELDTMSLQIEMLNENIISSHFPLTVVVSQIGEDEFVLSVKYNTTFYTEDFMRNFLKVYTESLQQLERPKVSTSFAIIKGVEKQELPFNSLIEGFETWVKKTPDKTALCYAGIELSYKYLNEQGNFIYSQLIERKANNCIVVCLSAIENYAPAIIGILKAGLHFINIDASFSQKTIERIFQQLTPSVVITDKPVDNITAFFAPGNRINLEQGIGRKVEGPTISADSRGLVTINYTSGSTGEPKLVKIDNKSHLNRLNWLMQNFPAKAEDQYILKSSFSFAPALRELFEPLCQGATLHAIPNSMLKNVNEFCAFMQTNKITRIFLTPSYIKLLMTNNKLVELKGLKILEISGEPYSYELVQTLNTVLPNTILLNRYGCTEAASVVYHTFSKESSVFANRIPSGRPIFNTEIIICDQHFQTTPIGVIGVILIKSTCLSLGYVNEEHNENKFIRLNGSTWLNTEDLGYIDDDGNLYYVSRGSRMVKIRGYRVELDELEIVAKNHSDIKNAYADVETNDYGSFIVFYYSSFSKDSIDNTVLKEHFLSELPEYAVPYRYVFVSVFPLTLNGKVDAQALKKLGVPKLEHKQNFSEDESMEKNIANILKNLLRREEEIDPMDDFRSLGLDSILSMYFLHKIHNVLGIKADPILLYKNNTIRLFVNALNNNENQVNYSVVNPASKNIVFIITPASDIAIDFNYISDKLTHNFSLVIFDPVNLHTEVTLDMETLGIRYAEEIRNYLSTITAVESINIGGWSLGATIAYEVAVQFKKENVAFNHLMLIDPGFCFPEYDDQVTRTSLASSLEKLDPDRIFTDRYINALLKANQIIRNYNPEKLDQEITLIKPKDISSFERNYHHKFNQLDTIGNTAINLVEINGNHMTITQDMEGILELFNEIIHSS
ncbi:amino acid adenylation domain-containing protein [Flavobacterium oreochromis]|uniref:amino acid adenylation domain-containing protein n=1 Tax=Flavobacterium oreochromis TaxID=2906078 RepID=UPI003859554E